MFSLEIIAHLTYLQYCTPYNQAQFSVVYIFNIDAKVVTTADEFRFQDNFSFLRVVATKYFRFKENLHMDHISYLNKIFLYHSTLVF